MCNFWPETPLCKNCGQGAWFCTCNTNGCNCAKCSKVNCDRRRAPIENAFHNVDESRFASFGLPADYLNADGSFKQPQSIPDSPQRVVQGVDETHFGHVGNPADSGYKDFLETT